MTPPGINPETVRLIAQCLNHYATPGPLIIQFIVLNPSGSIHGIKIPDDGVLTPTHVEVNTDSLFYTYCVVQVLAF